MADISGLSGTALDLYNSAIGKMTDKNTTATGSYNNSFSKILVSYLPELNSSLWLSR